MSSTHDANGEPPAARLQQMIAGYRVTQAIFVAAKLGLADALAGGPLSSDEVARQTSTHAPSLERLLRGLAGVGLFTEDQDGRWSATPLATYLRADFPGSLRNDAILYGEPWSWEPWGKLLWSVQTGEPAFSQVYGMSRFNYLATHPEANVVFNAAMTGSTLTDSVATSAYDLSAVGTLIDIGGGQGAALAALLRTNPRLRGTLFDLPHVVAEAPGILASAGVAARCTVVGGDFFVAVPSDGDAYLLRHVLHNWNDQRAQELLAICRQAIGATGKLLIETLVINRGRQSSDPMLLDLHMLVSHGGRERTADEFRDLLATAGFAMSRVVPIAGALCLIEADPV